MSYWIIDHVDYIDHQRYIDHWIIGSFSNDCNFCGSWDFNQHLKAEFLKPYNTVFYNGHTKFK